ncbi:hypothetical protein HK104_005503, partial [Borealophlyctis nickersoniae]
MQNELLCAVCLEMYRDVRRTPCDHMYCRTCIVAAIEKYKKCPLCGFEVTIPTLTSCIKVQDMVDHMRRYLNEPVTERSAVPPPPPQSSRGPILPAGRLSGADIRQDRASFIRGLREMYDSSTSRYGVPSSGAADSRTRFNERIERLNNITSALAAAESRRFHHMELRDQRRGEVGSASAAPARLSIKVSERTGSIADIIDRLEGPGDVRRARAAPSSASDTPAAAAGSESGERNDGDAGGSSARDTRAAERGERGGERSPWLARRVPSHVRRRIAVPHSVVRRSALATADPASSSAGRTKTSPHVSFGRAVPADGDAPMASAEEGSSSSSNSYDSPSPYDQIARRAIPPSTKRNVRFADDPFELARKANVTTRSRRLEEASRWGADTDKSKKPANVSASASASASRDSAPPPDPLARHNGDRDDDVDEEVMTFLNRSHEILASQPAAPGHTAPHAHAPAQEQPAAQQEPFNPSWLDPYPQTCLVPHLHHFPPSAFNVNPPLGGPSGLIVGGGSVAPNAVFGGPVGGNAAPFVFGESAQLPQPKRSQPDDHLGMAPGFTFGAASTHPSPPKRSKPNVEERNRRAWPAPYFTVGAKRHKPDDEGEEIPGTPPKSRHSFVFDEKPHKRHNPDHYSSLSTALDEDESNASGFGPAGTFTPPTSRRNDVEWLVNPRGSPSRRHHHREGRDKKPTEAGGLLEDVLSDLPHIFGPSASRGAVTFHPGAGADVHAERVRNRVLAVPRSRLRMCNGMWEEPSESTSQVATGSNDGVVGGASSSSITTQQPVMVDSDEDTVNGDADKPLKRLPGSARITRSMQVTLDSDGDDDDMDPSWSAPYVGGCNVGGKGKKDKGKKTVRFSWDEKDGSSVEVASDESGREGKGKGKEVA